jgi:hypothetical protein
MRLLSSSAPSSAIGSPPRRRMITTSRLDASCRRASSDLPSDVGGCSTDRAKKRIYCTVIDGGCFRH